MVYPNTPEGDKLITGFAKQLESFAIGHIRDQKIDQAFINDFLNMFDAPYLKGAPFLEEGPTLKQARLSLACAALRPSFAADRSLRLPKPPVHRLLGCCILVSALSSSVGNREPG